MKIEAVLENEIRQAYITWVAFCGWIKERERQKENLEGVGEWNQTGLGKSADGGEDQEFKCSLRQVLLRLQV